MDINEIRDYLERAPRKWSFDGKRLTNTTRARLLWLADIARGTLHERINRRAGIVSARRPWHNPTWHAIERHRRRLIRTGQFAALQQFFGQRGANANS